MVSIYVGNLPYEVSENDLQDLFSQYGQVSRTNIIMDHGTGRARGFAFVEMASEDEGQKAIDSLNGQDYNGRTLTVNIARPRENNRPRMGGDRGFAGNGGFGGGGARGGFGGGGQRRSFREE